LYWKPEQPPASTASRSPAPGLPSRDAISATCAPARGVTRKEGVITWSMAGT
jgi:hypothetical protein